MTRSDLLYLKSVGRFFRRVIDLDQSGCPRAAIKRLCALRKPTRPILRFCESQSVFIGSNQPSLPKTGQNAANRFGRELQITGNVVTRYTEPVRDARLSKLRATLRYSNQKSRQLLLGGLKMIQQGPVE